jgi:hypothetical protein
LDVVGFTEVHPTRKSKITNDSLIWLEVIMEEGLFENYF